ncbi:MAG: flippase-like domain-containing protein [Aquificaceae bacterium]
MKKLLPFLLTLSFLLLLFYFIPIGEIIQSLRGIKVYSLAFAFLLYSLSQILRSLRWRLLIKGLSFFDLFLVNSANIMFNNLMPARTGEASWFYYLRRMGVNWTFSLWFFLLGRLYDLIGLLLLLLLSLSLVKSVVLLPFFLLLLLSLSLPYVLPKEELKDLFKREGSYKLSLYLLSLSSLSHMAKFGSLFVLLNLKHLDLYKSLLAFFGGELSSVLPLHSFMGFGTYELAFSIPLKLLGEGLREWLKMGFIFHSFLLLSSLLWGIPSTILLVGRGTKSP